MFVYSRHPVFVRSLHHRTDTASQEVFWSTSSRCTTSEKFGLIPTYREIFPFSSISDLKLRKLDWRSYGNMVIQMRSCVCDWCELPPPHRHQPVTSPVKLDNSSKGTFTVKCVMFVHRAPDMGIPSMIQPASWIWQWNVLLQWCNKVLGETVHSWARLWPRQCARSWTNWLTFRKTWTQGAPLVGRVI